MLLDLRSREQVEVHFFWNLIAKDADDNKFVDCAIAANADYLITHDGHYSVLNEIDFPKVRIATIPEFSAIFKQNG